MTNLANALSEFTGAAESKIASLADAQRNLRADLAAVATPVAAPIETKAEREYRAVFGAFLQNPTVHQTRLREASRDLKDVSFATNAGGGFALPKAVNARIEGYARTLCPWMDPDLCGVQPVPSTDYRIPFAIAETSAARTTETGTRTQTGTSTMREVLPRWGEYYTYCQASEHAREDIVGIEDFIAREAATQLAAKLAADIVSGSGSSGQLQGFLTQTPVTTVDSASPLRNALALQYSPVASASPLGIAPQDVALLLSEFNEAYLADGSFAIVMRASTWRSLVASSGEAPFTMPRNPTLYGYPVRFCGAMPALVENAFPIVAGAWKLAYALVAREPLRLVVDENITSPGQVKWRIYGRFGGVPKDNNSAKALKLAAS